MSVIIIYFVPILKHIKMIFRSGRKIRLDYLFITIRGDMTDQGEIFDETAGLTLRRVARAEHTPLGRLQGAGAGHLKNESS